MPEVAADTTCLPPGACPAAFAACFASGVVVLDRSRTRDKLPLGEAWDAGRARGSSGRWSMMQHANIGPTRALLRLIGPLRLVAPGGADCTPGGEVRKALLAVLALSPGGSRSRAVLKDMFWGAKDPKRAAGSLRSALTTLREELAPAGGLLRIDGQSVTLDLAAVDVDVLAFRDGSAAAPPDPDGPDLLEGIDLAGDDREGFEDWLRIERSRWVDFLDAPTPAAPGGRVAPPREAVPAPRAGIGLLPVVCDAPVVAASGDAILDLIAAEARSLLHAEIYDYRDAMRGPPGPAPAPAAGPGLTLAGEGPAHLMQLSMQPAGSGLRLALRLCDAGTGRMAWTRTATAPAGLLLESAEVGGFLSLVLEQLAATLSPVGGYDGAAPGTPYQTMNLMFSLAPDALDRADDLLDRAYAQTGAPIHLGLMSYVDTFRVGESWSTASAVRDITALTREGLAGGSFDGLYLTTAGYALLYLTDEFELAADLLARAVEVSPGQAIGWDHLAMYHYFQGDYGQALAASERAAHLGRFSPLRYAYDTTLAIIAHATGDLDRATAMGRRALARQPGFSSALKVVASATGLKGDRAAAAGLAQQILQQDPSFRAGRRTPGMARMRDPEAARRMAAGLVAAGLE